MAIIMAAEEDGGHKSTPTQREGGPGLSQVAAEPAFDSPPSLPPFVPSLFHLAHLPCLAPSLAEDVSVLYVVALLLPIIDQLACMQALLALPRIHGAVVRSVAIVGRANSSRARV